MSERMTIENQIPTTLAEQIEIMIAVGGLSPAQASTFRQAADRIKKLEADYAEAEVEYKKQVRRGDQWQRKYEALVDILIDEGYWNRIRPLLGDVND